MNYLAIDTSGKNLTVAICKDGEIYKYFDSECGVQHSVVLMPTLERLVEQANFDLGSVDFFAVNIGAGSFTGIRIGVSTVKALCFAYNKPVLAVTSFDALAYNVKDGKTLAVIDAGHGSYYVCGYDNLKVTVEPSFVSREEVERLSKEYRLLSSTKLVGLESEVVNVCDGFIKAVEQKSGEVVCDLDLLNPLYVRKSQAEEGRK